MRRIHRNIFIALSALALALSASCKREERGFRVDPPSASRINTKRLSDLQPGVPAPHVSLPRGIRLSPDGTRVYVALSTPSG